MSLILCATIKMKTIVGMMKIPIVLMHHRTANQAQILLMLHSHEWIEFLFKHMHVSCLRIVYSLIIAK